MILETKYDPAFPRLDPLAIFLNVTLTCFSKQANIPFNSSYIIFVMLEF